MKDPTRNGIRNRAATLVMAAAMLVASLALPGATLAADGQVLAPGTDIAGDVFLTGGHAKINFNNIGDCPNGLPNCFVEVQFRWFCQEWWCVAWDQSTWLKVPAGQDSYTLPTCVDGGNKWEVRTRLHWIAPTTHTVQVRGETEYHLGITGVIAKFLGDLTTGTGFFGSVLITTQTGTDQFAGEAVLGQSSGFLAGPSSC